MGVSIPVPRYPAWCRRSEPAPESVGSVSESIVSCGSEVGSYLRLIDFVYHSSREPREGR